MSSKLPAPGSQEWLTAHEREAWEEARSLGWAKGVVVFRSDPRDSPEVAYFTTHRGRDPRMHADRAALLVYLREVRP